MPPQSNNGADANETSRLVDSSTPDHPARDRRDQQAAAAAAAMADEGHQRAMFSAKVQHSDGRDEAAVPVHRNRTVSSLSPNAPDAQRKPPHPMAPQQQPAISLFSGDEDGDVPASVRGASSGGRGVSRATRHGIASGEFPQPSRQPSLRPWEWPDVFRGHKGRISGSELWPTVHCGPTDNVEEGLRYSTPYEPRSFTRDNTPSGEGEDEGREDTGEDGFAPDGWEEAMGKASGEGHREDDGGIERRRSCGGLEQVKKRLWGSMFEGTTVVAVFQQCLACVPNAKGCRSEQKNVTKHTTISTVLVLCTVFRRCFCPVSTCDWFACLDDSTHAHSRGAC